MQELILWEARLFPYHPGFIEGFFMTDWAGNGATDPLVGNEKKMVGESTSLDEAINWIVAKSTQYGGDVSLKIMAHGYEPTVGFTAGSPSLPAPPPPPVGSRGGAPTPSAVGLMAVSSQGGGGIQFCREGILLSTIHKFGVLSNRPNSTIGKVKKIEILGCGAAYITPGFEGRTGDGNLLCYRLAQFAQTYVRASTAAQSYSFGHHQPLQFGPWTGTVVTYSPTGAGVPDYPAGIR